MLQKGQRGEEVKTLQQKLRKEGLFTHKADTGFFGPQTENAVKEYQRQRGVKVDGVYGPRTKHMLENEDHAKALLNSPHIQGTHHQAVLKQMYASGDHAINLGKGGVHVTPSDVENLYSNLDKQK